VRWGELRVIGLFVHDVTMPDNTHVSPQALYEWLGSNKADRLSWEQMAIISATLVPQFLRWPCALLLLAMAGLAWRYAPRRKMRTVFTLEDLIKVQAEAWPVNSPITKINPATGPQRAPGDPMDGSLPLFAEALSPEEFVSFHRIPMQDRSIDHETAAKIFVRQLGARWQTWQKLPWHYQALAAVFALKGARKRDAADELLGEISVSWDPKAGLQLSPILKSKIRGLLRDPKVGGEAAKIMAGHAFVVPGMFSLLLWARERGGVLASATFIWLRAVDRSLWYPLNNAGRRTFAVEAAGAVAHYHAERFLKRPLIIPKVQGAVNALADYIKETELAIPPNSAPLPHPRSSFSTPRASQVGALAVSGGRA
jgi:intracellular multiplication protein IcmP